MTAFDMCIERIQTWSFLAVANATMHLGMTSNDIKLMRVIELSIHRPQACVGAVE
jgi:hypothetical protein